MAENGHSNGNGTGKYDHLTQYQVRFQPGESGNPGGRPSLKLLTKAAREKLAEVQPSGLTTAEEIILALIKKALTGDTYAISLLWDRSEGKLTQTVAGLVGHAALEFENEQDIRARIYQKLFGYDSVDAELVEATPSVPVRPVNALQSIREKLAKKLEEL